MVFFFVLLFFFSSFKWELMSHEQYLFCVGKKNNTHKKM